MPENRRCLTVLVVLASPFYLNDFANIYVKHWAWWLLVDYVAVKLFPLLVVCWLVRTRTMPASGFGLTRQPAVPFVVACLAVALAGTFIDQNAYRLVARLPGYPALGSMPEIPSPAWNWIDLTLGLLAVGVVEELVFRAYVHTVLSRCTGDRPTIVVASALAFGLIHWSNGLHAVLVTATIGALFMIAYLVTRSVPALALAHFVINFVDFAGVIPKSMFKVF